MMYPRYSQTVAQTLIVAFTLAVLLLGVGLAASGAHAQELPGQNQTTTDPTTKTYDQLGDLVIHDYSFNNGEMTISATWRGERPERVTLTEMIELDSSGSTKISFKQIRLIPDEKTKITIGAEMSSGTAAVLITTPQSVSNNNALVLQAGDGADRDPVPFGQASLLIGLAAVGGAGLAFAFTLRDRDEDDDRRERIA